MKRASGRFRVKVEDPYWIELPDDRNANSYIDAIRKEHDESC